MKEEAELSSAMISTRNEVTVRGCSFSKDRLEDRPIIAEHITITDASLFGCPLEGLNGNVFWPDGWNDEQRREWRRQRFCNGAEWEFANDGLLLIS